jgi:hypothetical protein
MIHRAGLVFGSAAAVIVLTVALAAAGFAPGVATPTGASTATTAAPAELSAAATAQATPSAAPTVVYDNTYVTAAPTPRTVIVHKPAPSQKPVIVNVAPAGEPGDGGEQEGRGGGGDD